ncbi:MAG: RNA-binding S4 domain-containing protein [Planctomycetota bacterium]|jgi:ribosome-associated protein
MTDDPATPESPTPAQDPAGTVTFELERRDITLGNLLKIHLTVSGGEAKLIVQSGQVRVNGELCEARGRRLFGGELVEIEGDPPVRLLPCKNP